MPVKIGGLPAHVLLIHAVVVLVPLAAFMLVASAVWPAARAKLGFLTPAVALVALILVPITTHAGEWLKNHLGFTNKAIQKHVRLGHELLPWSAGIFVLAAVVWVLHRRFDMPWRPGRTGGDAAGTPADPVDAVEPADAAAGAPVGAGAGGTATLARSTGQRRELPVWVTAVLAVLSVAVAVGGLIQLYRIGDSGAHAVWNGVATGK